MFCKASRLYSCICGAGLSGHVVWQCRAPLQGPLPNHTRLAVVMPCRQGCEAPSPQRSACRPPSSLFCRAGCIPGSVGRCLIHWATGPLVVGTVICRVWGAPPEDPECFDHEGRQLDPGLCILAGSRATASHTARGGRPGRSFRRDDFGQL